MGPGRYWYVTGNDVAVDPQFLGAIGHLTTSLDPPVGLRTWRRLFSKTVQVRAQREKTAPSNHAMRTRV